MKKSSVLGLCFGFIHLLLTGCGSTGMQKANTETKPSVIFFNVVQEGGVSNSITTVSLTLTFSADPTTLKTDNIALTGAAKGVLSGKGKTRNLTISDITVANGAKVSVIIANPAGFTISGSPQSTVVYTALKSEILPVYTLTHNDMDIINDSTLIFPNYGLGSVKNNQTIVLVNTGLVNFTYNFTMSGSNIVLLDTTPNYSSSNMTGILQPGEIANIIIKYRPLSDAGIFDIDLESTINDVSILSCKISIQPVLNSLTLKKIPFFRTDLFTSESSNIELLNTGTNPIRITEISSDQNNFKLSTFTGVIAPGNSVSYTISYSPSSFEEKTVTFKAKIYDGSIIEIFGSVKGTTGGVFTDVLQAKYTNYREIYSSSATLQANMSHLTVTSTIDVPAEYKKGDVLISKFSYSASSNTLGTANIYTLDLGNISHHEVSVRENNSGKVSIKETPIALDASSAILAQRVQSGDYMASISDVVLAICTPRQ